MHQQQDQQVSNNEQLPINRNNEIASTNSNEKELMPTQQQREGASSDQQQSIYQQQRGGTEVKPHSHLWQPHIISHLQTTMVRPSIVTTGTWRPFGWSMMTTLNVFVMTAMMAHLSSEFQSTAMWGDDENYDDTFVR